MLTDGVQVRKCDNNFVTIKFALCLRIVWGQQYTKDNRLLGQSKGKGRLLNSLRSRVKYIGLNLPKALNRLIFESHFDLVSNGGPNTDDRSISYFAEHNSLGLLSGAKQKYAGYDRNQGANPCSGCVRLHPMQHGFRLILNHHNGDSYSFRGIIRRQLVWRLCRA